MYRFKVSLGEELSSRNTGNQVAEAILKCKILNMMPTPASLASQVEVANQHGGFAAADSCNKAVLVCTPNLSSPLRTTPC
mgnify:CR=1 FL=1